MANWANDNYYFFAQQSHFGAMFHKFWHWTLQLTSVDQAIPVKLLAFSRVYRSSRPGNLTPYSRTRNIIFEARLFRFMAYRRGILHLMCPYFPVWLIERGHYIWSALNDSKIGGLVTGAKWLGDVQIVGKTQRDVTRKIRGCGLGVGCSLSCSPSLILFARSPTSRCTPLSERLKQAQ